MKTRAELLRFVRYCIVGCINTLLTLCVIFVSKSYLGINPYVSNVTGYAVGLANSFLWNRSWVFHAGGGLRPQALRFLIGFAICYGLQFTLVWGLTQGSFGSREFDLGPMVLSGYGIATLAGNVLYTVCNFAYNRLVTFRPAR